MKHAHHHNPPKAEKRLNIIAGQIKGLQDMVKQDKYCVDILTQSMAIKSALSSFEDLILENHLATHVVEQMKHGKKDKAIAEIMLIYQLSKKK